MNTRLRLAGATALVALALSACSEANEVGDRIGKVGDDIGNASDKAGACTQALGLSDLSPELNWEHIRDSAAERAQKLQNLAERTANADVRDALSGLADAYLDLEQHKVDRMRDVKDWVDRNADRFGDLRDACL